MVVVRVRSLGIVEIPIVEAAAVTGAVAGRVLLVVVVVVLLVVPGTPISTTPTPTPTPVIRILVLGLVLILGGVLDTIRVIPTAAALALMAPCHHVSHADAAPGEARQFAVIVVKRSSVRDLVASARMLLVLGVAFRFLSLVLRLLPYEVGQCLLVRGSKVGEY